MSDCKKCHHGKKSHHGKKCCHGKTNISNTHKKVLIEGAENFYYAGGLRFDKFNVNNDIVYVADSFGTEIVVMNPKTGTILEIISTIPLGFPTPQDLDIGPDSPLGGTRGTIYVTSGLSQISGGIGRIHPDGTFDVIVPHIPQTVGISFSPDGKRLFISQVFYLSGLNAVYEILQFADPNPSNATEVILVPSIDSPGGGLDGFVTGKDGFIYGPLRYDGYCVKIDPNGVYPGNVTPIPCDKEPFYGSSHAAFDSCGRLYVSDVMGRLIRIDNLKTGKSKVLGNFTSIDTVSLDSNNRIYLSGGNLADVAQLVCKDHKYRKRVVSKSGLSQLGSISVAIVSNKLFVAEGYLLAVYNKYTGEFERHIHQKDWQPDASLNNVQTAVTFDSVSPMNHGKLLTSTFVPFGRFTILDIHQKYKVSLTSFFLANPETFVIFTSIALDNHTIIAAGIDQGNNDAALVQKIVLDDNYQPIEIVSITVPDLILPVSLAKTKDGSKVYISDYFGFNPSGPPNFPPPGTGAIYVLNMTTLVSSVVVNTGLLFPQGIALTKDEEYLLFLEELTNSLKAIDLSNISNPPIVVADNLGSLNIEPDFEVRFVPQGGISYVTVDKCTGVIYVVASGSRKLWEIEHKCKD